MKKSIILSLILAFCSQVGYAGLFGSNECRNLETYSSKASAQKILDEHLIVLHASTRSISEPILMNYLNRFFREMCKMPKDHRRVLKDHNLEIHLLVGSIAQHPRIQQLMRENVNPRGHSKNWNELPGVGGTAGANDPAGASPAIFNIASLDEGHGSLNLVLHELAHSFDHFKNRNDSSRNLVSSSRGFNRIMTLTPWENIYLTGHYVQPPERPVLDLSSFQHMDPETRVAYESGARSAFQGELNAWQTSVQNVMRNARIDLSYHQNEPEENFAELYSHYYHSQESKQNLRRVFPEAYRYFSNL